MVNSISQIADSFEMGSSISDFRKEVERNNLEVEYIVTNWIENDISEESKDYGACKVVPLEDDRCCFYVSGVKVGISEYVASFSANNFTEEEINNASQIFENVESDNTDPDVVELFQGWNGANPYTKDFSTLKKRAEEIGYELEYSSYNLNGVEFYEVNVPTRKGSMYFVDDTPFPVRREEFLKQVSLQSDEHHKLLRHNSEALTKVEISYLKESILDWFPSIFESINEEFEVPTELYANLVNDKSEEIREAFVKANDLLSGELEAIIEPYAIAHVKEWLSNWEEEIEKMERERITQD